MPRYKPIERHGMMLPVDLSEQIVPGSFAFARDYLVDFDLSSQRWTPGSRMTKWVQRV